MPALHSDAVLMHPQSSDNLESPWLTLVLPRFMHGDIALILPWVQTRGFPALVPLLALWTCVVFMIRRWETHLSTPSAT